MTRTKKLLLPGLLSLLLFAALVSLGVWQLQRKVWKEGLIAEVEARARAAPIPLESIPTAWRRADGAGQADFARVVALGHFNHGKELHLLSPQREGAAWMIVTPFETPEGPVLVMRGIVPEALKDPAKRAAGQVGGDITIEGRIRLSEPKGLFTPASDVVKNNWFSRDLGPMQEATGLTETGRRLPFFIELERPVPPGGWPRPQLDAVNLRNDHLQYAITWFALAAVTAAMFGFWAASQMRKTPEA